MSWFIILSDSLFHILLKMQLTFCIGTEIPHFFCELDQWDSEGQVFGLHVLWDRPGVLPQFGCDSSQKSPIASVMWTMVTSMLNPFIYSLII
ncbi:hypothetical protein HPG69_008173 [Diceros bicornis minor]|uniref:G-protein coupled receptors family 1 profile domain-containing protein n=1 Tax=Diceros bicornis minor TaxID=77932 RepID=A0A7J7E848_DICBM|nr:hypothetical protein HPG69_008173 [Diceros bicornis minor]